MIDNSFYQREDVVEVARDLLGKVLFTRVDGQLTAGMIVETEAYCGATDRACHAFPHKKTARNAVMFGEGGRAYVYLIYGIHHLFNIVTNAPGKADAVLVRALEPLEGMEVMKKRRDKRDLMRITAGPGSLSRAMGIDLDLYGQSLTGRRVWLEDRGIRYEGRDIHATTRIGVDYAEEDALLPWRFYVKNNVWVSKK